MPLPHKSRHGSKASFKLCRKGFMWSDNTPAEKNLPKGRMMHHKMMKNDSTPNGGGTQKKAHAGSSELSVPFFVYSDLWGPTQHRSGQLSLVQAPLLARGSAVLKLDTLLTSTVHCSESSKTSIQTFVLTEVYPFLGWVSQVQWKTP
jgi:hypothetical protein